MKKTNLWSLMALCCCLFGALTLTTSCGDDDDDDGTPDIETPQTDDKTDPTPTDTPALTGTWKSIHQGEQGAHYTDAITLNANGTFEENISQADLNYWTHELHSSEEVYKGTYSVKDGTYEVQVTEHQHRLSDDETLQADPDYEGDSFTLTFEKYGNGYVAVSPIAGGVQFYTKDGEARQMPSLSGNELVGRWEYVKKEEWSESMEMVDFYEFKADGTVEYGSYMRNYLDGFDSQGNKRVGVYVPVSETMARTSFDFTLPSGVKLFSIVDDADYQLSQRDPGNFNTNYWEFFAVRFGGHPLQYTIKDGKLYVGIIGMEEYFLERPYNKVQ